MTSASLDYDQYQVWYHPGIGLSRLRPGLTYQQACDRLNSLILSQGINIAQWRDPGDHSTAARLIRANWIYHTLDRCPIRKPLLVMPNQHGYQILCGDTRYMAVSHRTPTATVAVVAVLPKHDQTHNWTSWYPIKNDHELLSLCGLDAKTGQVHFGFSQDYGPWLEIGDCTTAAHMHDQTEREAIMQDFLNNQDNDFRFDKNWIAAKLPGLDKYYAVC
jgi:hypothetical protein